MATLVLVTVFNLLVSTGISLSPAPYDTIIIGLGAAGATAASNLAKAGKRVLALEAQDRIGGRVKTVSFGDGVVEEGAEWIHGTENNHVYDTAVKNNISVWPQNLKILLYNSDGRLCDNQLLLELHSLYTNISNTQSDRSESICSYVSRSVLTYLRENHPNVFENEYLVNEYLEIMNVYISNDFGSNDWNDISAKTPYNNLNGTSRNTWHRYGYKTYFDILLNTYNNGPGWPTLDIKLSKEITQIKWSPSSTGTVKVVCKDGDIYSADNVIVTVSLGVLKAKYSSMFSPSLPKDKTVAIKKIAFGSIGKIILAFSEKWWDSGSDFFFFYLPGGKTIFQNDKWLLKIREVTPPAGSSNTLTFWTTGDMIKLVELLPEDAIKNKCMKLLRQFLGRDMRISKPTGMIRSKWVTNTFIRGAYSYDDITLDQYPNLRATLGEPLVDVAGNPRVLFAGEATDVTHYATVHGASDSGYREAMRLLNVNK